MNEVDLRAIVEGVRARLDSADLSGAHECFRSFPRGACGATCDVLATILERRFGVEPQWVSADIGDSEEWCSHAWLEVEGFTIDITADQFGKEPVIVTKHSGWHQSLPIIQRVHYPMPQRNWGEVGRTVWDLVSDLAVPVSA
ncbi:hypothetical protein D3C85_1135190 [compost metagenome]